MPNETLKKIILTVAASAMLILSFLLVLNPRFRQKLNQLTQSDQRIVIAKLETNLSMPNKKFKIIKVQYNHNIWIEIYDMGLSEDRVAEFKLSSRHDGQMFVNKKASSLFASDIDGDQILEVITPSFSTELQPKIHAFKYNPITDSFSEISNQDLLRTLNI